MDLIIGMATGYNWDHLEAFVVSLRQSGYQGRCILIDGEGPHIPPTPWRIDPRITREALNRYNIEVLNFGRFEEHPMILRFKIVSDYLYGNPDFRYVMMVDTRDIIFQSDPIIWLEKNLGNRQLAIVSEGMLFKQTAWRNNIF